MRDGWQFFLRPQGSGNFRRAYSLFTTLSSRPSADEQAGWPSLRAFAWLENAYYLIKKNFF
jgi:hypothetical protein